MTHTQNSTKITAINKSKLVLLRFYFHFVLKEEEKERKEKRKKRKLQQMQDHLSRASSIDNLNSNVSSLKSENESIRRYIQKLEKECRKALSKRKGYR